MRTFPVTLVCCALLVAAPSAEWADAVKDLHAKVPRIETKTHDGREGTCSGAFVNADAGYVVSAAHCFEGEFVDVAVDGRDAAVVRKNRVIDLAVLRVDPKRSDKAFLLAPETPPVGTPIAVLGYAFGSRKLIMQFGHMALPLSDELNDAALVNVDVIIGDSGGPLIDNLGRLVGIQSAVVSYGPMHLGATIPLETVRDYVSQYLPVARSAPKN